MLLYGLTLAWGTEVTSFHVAPEAAAVSFAICDVMTREPTRAANKRYAGTQPGARSTPKKQPPEEKFHNMAVDHEATGGDAQARGASGDGAEDEEGEHRPELTHKEPSYKNARWLRKRPGAPRWTQKICRLLEGLMEADEIAEDVDMGTVVDDLWGILLDRDKAGKDALKTKIKEHKKRQKQKEKKQRKKERRKEKKGRKASKHKKGRRGSTDSTSSSSSTDSSSDSDSHSSSSGSSGSSRKSSRGQKDKGGQRSANQPEFKWIDGKRHFKSKKSGSIKTGCAAKGRPKVPAQTVKDITSGSTGRSSGAKGARNDFCKCKRMPGSRPSHGKTGSLSWSGRGRAPVTSSNRRWRQGTGQIWLPLSSGDGTKIRWVAICGRSNGWPGRSLCD